MSRNLSGLQIDDDTLSIALLLMQADEKNCGEAIRQIILTIPD